MPSLPAFQIKCLKRAQLIGNGVLSKVSRHFPLLLKDANFNYKTEANKKAANALHLKVNLEALGSAYGVDTWAALTHARQTCSWMLGVRNEGILGIYNLLTEHRHA